jgi:hypothetical protein
VVSARGFPELLEGTLDFLWQIVRVGDCDSETLCSGRESVRLVLRDAVQAGSRSIHDLVRGLSFGPRLELLKGEGQKGRPSTLRCLLPRIAAHRLQAAYDCPAVLCRNLPYHLCVSAYYWGQALTVASSRCNGQGRSLDLADTGLGSGHGAPFARPALFGKSRPRYSPRGPRKPAWLVTLTLE